MDPSILVRRQRVGLPIFGLAASSTAERWLSSYGTQSFALSHAEARADSFPLIKVGVLDGTAVDSRRGYIDVYDTLGSQLMLVERSRNDPAFQHETRDPAAIERELGAVPGPEAWTPTMIELDGRLHEFLRLDHNGDWIAFRDLGSECLWIHAEQPDGQPISIITLDDIEAYLAPTA